MTMETGDDPWYRSHALWWIGIGYASLIVALCWAWLPRVTVVLVPAWGSLADWFAAVGTISATVTAIYFGMRSMREGNRDRHIRAGLAAAKVAGLIEPAVNALGHPVAEWVFRDLVLPPQEKKTWQDGLFAFLAAQLKGPAFTMTFELLEALIPLPGHAAHRIARAMGQLEAVAQELRTAEETNVWHTAELQRRDHMLGGWIAIVTDAQGFLQVAREECLRAADLMAPRPTGQEIYGGPDEDFN